MAKTSTITYSISITGDGVNEQSVAGLVQNLASPGVRYVTTLGAGNATFQNTFSANACTIVLSFPSSSTAIKTLKGVAGDTGVVLSNTNPTAIALPAGGSFVLNLNATETITYWIL